MPARAIQVRALTTIPDGFSVAFTEGYVPLPAGESGQQIFASEADLQQQIREFTAGLTRHQMLLMLLGMTWLQPNGTFGNVNNVLNKQLQVDLTAAQPFKIV